MTAWTSSLGRRKEWPPRAEGPAPVGSHETPSRETREESQNYCNVTGWQWGEQKEKKKKTAKIRKYQNNSGLCCSSKTTTGQSPFLTCFNVALSQCLEQLQCLTAITQWGSHGCELKTRAFPSGKYSLPYAHSDFKFLKCNLPHFELYFSHAHYHYLNVFLFWTWIVEQKDLYPLEHHIIRLPKVAVFLLFVHSCLTRPYLTYTLLTGMTFPL